MAPGPTDSLDTGRATFFTNEWLLMLNWVTGMDGGVLRASGSSVAGAGGAVGSHLGLLMPGDAEGALQIHGY
jgi:hypothetical protein